MADHDSGYKLLFSLPAMVEELLRGFVHEPWVADLDFATLEQVRSSLVSDDFRQRHTDIVWRLRWRGSEARWFYVYLLLEFQSTPDPWMPLRLLSYVALLLELLHRERGEPADLADGLPLVLPIVLYNGRRPWNAPLDVASLFRDIPPGAERYVPQLTYLLIDESRFTTEELALPGNRVATLFQLEAARPVDLPRLTRELATDIPRGQEPALRRAFVAWILRLYRRHLPGATIPTEVHDLEEIAMLGETLEEWWTGAREVGRQEGMREGQQAGEITGMRKLLLNLLEQRFGKLPGQVASKIGDLRSAADIEALLRRALGAHSLDDLQLG